MIVAGRDPIVPPLSPEAVRQLELRRRLAALAAGEYLRDGFTVVLQDIYIGSDLSDILTRLGPPLYLVALTARPEVIAERERQRGKAGYGVWSVESFALPSLRRPDDRLVDRHLGYLPERDGRPGPRQPRPSPCRLAKIAPNSSSGTGQCRRYDQLFVRSGLVHRNMRQCRVAMGAWPVLR